MKGITQQPGARYDSGGEGSPAHREVHRRDECDFQNGSTVRGQGEAFSWYCHDRRVESSWVHATSAGALLERYDHHAADRFSQPRPLPRVLFGAQ